MRIVGARHTDGTGQVLKAIVCFVLDRRLSRFFLHAAFKASPLDHKPRDHAVKDRAIIVTTFDIFQKIRNRYRCILSV